LVDLVHVAVGSSPRFGQPITSVAPPQLTSPQVGLEDRG
jgi:hypothetical protein